MTAALLRKGLPMTSDPTIALAPLRPGERIADHEWLPRLAASGTVRDGAVEQLRDLMVRAARHQVSHMSAAADLGQVRRDEIIHSAANEATLSVLSRLGSFEGRSRFTTWAFKFGILQAGVEVRRASWSGREINLHDAAPVEASISASPSAVAEGNDLAAAVREAMQERLTAHQRKVALALLVDGVPIDVLAGRLGTTRGALYKTLHDARQRIRAHLEARGLLDTELEGER